MSDFSNKIAVVTGASRGLGAATAAELARRGTTVIANHPDEDAETHRMAIESWWNDLKSHSSGQVIPVAADVGDIQRVGQMFDDVRQQFNQIDFLVNNAGINRDRTVAKMSDEEWRDVIRVNLDGIFYCCRAAIPQLNDGGRIINISSVTAYTSAYGTANYSASKAGVLGLPRTLATELAARRITVNAICPGYFDTDMARSIPQDALQQFIDRIPLKRLGDPQEIADCVAFLASDQASYITGQAIQVNGGIFFG